MKNVFQGSYINALESPKAETFFKYFPRKSKENVDKEFILDEIVFLHERFDWMFKDNKIAENVLEPPTLLQILLKYQTAAIMPTL